MAADRLSMKEIRLVVNESSAVIGELLNYIKDNLGGDIDEELEINANAALDNLGLIDEEIGIRYYGEEREGESNVTSNHG